MTQRRAKKVYGLIGRNVDYSWSPLIHNTAFELLGLPCIYTIFNIADPALIGEALNGGRALGIGGFNVTIPYKKDVVPFLDGLSPEAESIGAVNTIVNDGSRLIGHNTDIEGFASPLMPMAERIAGTTVAIFGNGGAALAAVEAFRRYFRTSSVLLFVRDLGKADEMLEGYAHRDLVSPRLIADLDHTAGNGSLEECSVVVNATPIGTAGRLDAVDSIVPDGPRRFRPGQIVYDMVYNPLDTTLLLDAKTAGAETVSGIEMLIGQAAGAFAIWTGMAMPMDRVKAAVMREIAGNA